MGTLAFESMTKNMHLVQVQAWFFPLMILLIGLSNILVILIGGMQFINGQIELGTLAEFIVYQYVDLARSYSWLGNFYYTASRGFTKTNQ